MPQCHHGNSPSLADLLQVTSRGPQTSYNRSSRKAGSRAPGSLASAALGCSLMALPRLAHLTSPDQSVSCHPRLLMLQHFRFRLRSFSHDAKRKTLTKAPFISLKTTPLKTKAVWGSVGSSCSSRHPSCLREDRKSQWQCLWQRVHTRPSRHLPEV